jgi:predicted Zn-dependent peptidase
MEDLNAAKLEEFQAFYKKYYVPNNATLVVAGDINLNRLKNGLRNTTEEFQKEQFIRKISRKMLLSLRKKK